MRVKAKPALPSESKPTVAATHVGKAPNAAPKTAGGDRVHTSVYLPHDVWRRLRAIAAAEDRKVHDLVIEGVKSVVARRAGEPGART